MERVGVATAGVGIGPRSSGSMPTEDEAGDQRTFDHIPREMCVLADYHSVPSFAPAENYPGGLTDFQCEFRGYLLIRFATDAVSAEIITFHMLTLLPLIV